MNFRKLTATVIMFCILISTMTGFSGSLKVNAAGYADTSEYESLAELYKEYFKIGAVSGEVISNSAKSDTVSRLFNSMTCENEMKPAYNFNPYNDNLLGFNSDAVKLLNWAKEHGVAMRGHCLVWHSQVNPKFFAKNFKATCNGKETTADSDWLDEECLVDRDTLIDRMQTYIYSVMEYVYSHGYADVIYAWDVVNEAIDAGKSDGLRQSTWYRILGPDFLYYAFLFAREAEVKYAKEYASLYGLDAEKDDLSPILAKLFYNDYSEWETPRTNAIIKYATEYKFNENQSMVKSDVIKANGDGTLKGDGLIDGIGMQGHLSDTNNIDTYIKALKRYSDAVGEVQITELDVGATHSGESRWYRQAEFFYDLFSALIEADKDGANISSVTIWGLTDDRSWRSSDYPTLLNKDLSRKPAYNALVMAAKGMEFDITLAETIEDLSDTYMDFEKVKEGSSNVMVNPADLGIMSRGTGHQPVIALQFKTNHTPDIELGFALSCKRKEQDATMKFNITKYCGSNLTVTMYVMTDDNTIRVGLDQDEPVVLQEKQSTKGEWNKICFNTDIPEGKSAFLFVETDGMADIFVDDVSFVFTKEGEQPPVIEDMNDSKDNFENIEDTKDIEDSTSENSVKEDSLDASKPSESSTLSGRAIFAIIAGCCVVAACGTIAVIMSRKKRKK